MNKTNCALGVLAALLLTACGGGGSAPAQTPAEKLAASKLDPYIGAWVAPCDGHYQATLTLSKTAGSANTATFVVQGQYYGQNGCNGAVVATATRSANITATYTASTDTHIVFFPNSGPGISATVDHFSLLNPAYSWTLSGSGVTHPVTDGQAQWCVTFADTLGTQCSDDVIVPARAPYIANFHINSNKLLYQVWPNATSGYDAPYAGSTKK